MNTKLKIATGVMLSLIALTLIFSLGDKDVSHGQQDFLVQRGNLEILVSVSGELQAENSRSIQGPAELASNNVRLNTIRIQNLVAEGTEVNRGDWIATLDRSEADDYLKNLEDLVQEAQAHYIRTQLDTAITLRNLRDEMINMEYLLEEKNLTLEQSRFEPPATIRQAEIELEKAQRALSQSKNNYLLRHRQAGESMAEASINLQSYRRRFQELQDVLNNFVITAPAQGMVIYHREWNGQKRGVGSFIHTRDLTVATLPDLSSMRSRVYINEIDISKIKPGQNVRISIDALPGSRYSGEVIQIANVGQQLANSDSKVFEVLIALNENDNLLRPGMTAGNVIVTGAFSDELYIPLEAVHIDENIPYVFTAGGIRQVIVTGQANGDYIIVEQGLLEGDRILLTKPKDPERFKKSGEELIAVINERNNGKQISGNLNTSL